VESVHPTRLELSVLLSRRRLDRELAAGCPADGDAERALRAAQLTGPTMRRQLARSLRRAVEPRPGLSAAVPAHPGVAADWREPLLGLADRLEAPSPLNPCGVARIHALLTDGGGPLYTKRADRPIEEAVWWIADGFQVTPADT
jgi:hypothetical protein